MGATALFVLALAQWSVSVRASCLALSLSVCLQMLDIGGGTPVRCALVPERSPFPKVWFSESARTLCVHWNSRDEERRSSRPCSVRSNPLCIGVTNLLRRWISGWTSSDWLAFGFKDLTVSDLYPLPQPPTVQFEVVSIFWASSRHLDGKQQFIHLMSLLPLICSLGAGSSQCSFQVCCVNPSSVRITDASLAHGLSFQSNFGYSLLALAFLDCISIKKRKKKVN